MSVLELGRVVGTPGALDLAKSNHLDLGGMLLRHQNGDWGDTQPADKRANDAALKNGSRILSVYRENGCTLWIITDGETDMCPACAGVGAVCEPDKGEWINGLHFRIDLPPRRLSTTILRPEDY